ncbi:MAG TPA: hypothetical protein VJ952_08675 [Opitutales bacterium]|nr:hypothetical protein [Opitutales bacterium]
MHPDDEPQTTLSKWPFILGDVLLVATALAIAILGGWQLTNWQVGACVAAVALGAALFALPYVVEFQVRVREEREERDADLRILERHILNAEQELGAIDARVRSLEAAASGAEEPNAALAEFTDQKFTQLEAAGASQQKAIQALERKLSEIPRDSPTGFDPEILKTIEKRLQALETSPPAPQAETVGPPPPPSEDPVNQEPVMPPGEKAATVKPEKNAAQIDRPKRSARERHGPEEARLLKRAISEKSDNSSAAVSRIIESKSKEQPKEAPEPPADLAEAESSDMLFDEEKITSPVQRTKAKKNDAVLTAAVFIGIGNKPYLRGSGGGLNWEKGVVMEFQEIGKWRWVAPSDLDAPLELQIYCNDEDPDKSGKYTLAPGQKLELTPVF